MVQPPRPPRPLGSWIERRHPDESHFRWFSDYNLDECCRRPASHTPKFTLASLANLPTSATFSIELTNDIFHNAFAIANNVVPELGQQTLTLPIVPVG